LEKMRLGKTNMMVTRLGFGGIPIQRCTQDEAVAVVKKCLDLGLTFIDTANAYTTSEVCVGKAIAGRRKDVIIATKTGARDRATAEKHLALSLKQLGTDYIDLYQFHNIADKEALKKVMGPGGSMEVFQEAKKKGVIKHIGVTSHSLDMAKEMVQMDIFESILFPINFVTDEAERELLPLCRKHDVGFIAMKPLAGGMLDNATLCFKYIFNLPDVVSVPGIEKPQEIEEIVSILNKPLKLTKTEEKEMKRIREELGPSFCHRCDYCQPCTTGIPISQVMTSPSFFKRQPPERFFTGNIVEAIKKAEGCSECGECETRCPYHLHIIETVAARVKWFNEEKAKWETTRVK
jgi:uncharacterized protein